MEIICTLCLYTKEAEHFHRDKTRNTGRQSHCKLCRRLYRKGEEIIVNPNYIAPEPLIVDMYCELCGKVHHGEYGSGRFCSQLCARGFSTKYKRKEINEKVSKTLKGNIPHNKGVSKLMVMCELTDSNKKIYTVEKRNCLFCNVQFEIKKITSKYCTYKCWVDHKAELRDKRTQYRLDCVFKFNVYDYPELFDLRLLEEYGWYSAANRGGNIQGISRDHMYSVQKGFDNGVDPAIIAHPMNCKLMKQLDNISKFTDCSITLEELEERIKNFNAVVAESG